MTKKRVNWQMFNMLQDAVSHFSQDPEGLRSVSDTGWCCYKPPADKPESIGCAIGMYIPTKDAIRLDDSRIESGGNIDGILNRKQYKYTLIPDWMKSMNKKFLSDIQKLHDTEDCWTTDNISETGKSKVWYMCKAYNLPFDKIVFKP